MIINKWIQCGVVPSPAEVSQEEGIGFLFINGRKVWPIRIGCLEPHNQLPRLSMLTMRDLTKKDFYFVCMEMCCRGFKRTSQVSIQILRKLVIRLHLDILSDFFLQICCFIYMVCRSLIKF